MTETQRSQQTARDTILKLLSDEEIARVSSAETAPGLTDGEEYLDLEHLDQGIQRAKAATKVMMGQVLPRSAIRADTWSKIVTQLTR